MRIVIDLQSCQSGSRHGGVGRYSMNLVQAMARNANGHDLQIVLSNLMLDGISDIYCSLDGLIHRNNIHFFKTTGPVADAFPENSFRARVAELIREQYIFGLQPDITYVTSLFEGLGEDVTTSVGRFYNGSTTAVTLYDLIPLVESEKYLTNEVSKVHYFRKIDDLKNAGILLSISEYSKKDAIQELGINPERITNISSAVDEKFKPWKVPQDLENQLKKRYGITRNFLMYVGSFDQRKNQETLIKAFAALPATVRSGLQLLIVGNGWDGVYAMLRGIASQAGLFEDELLFTGKIPDEDLLPLYNLCFLFVFPSFREGFGLPILEAMSCGTPVIGSDATSIPEVIGTDKALFNPKDVTSVTRKMYEAITDQSFRSYLVEYGLQHAKNFSWDASAKRAISAFEAKYEEQNNSKSYQIVYHPTSKLIKAIKELPEIKNAINDELIKISDNIEQIEITNNRLADNEEFNNSKIGMISTWNSKCGIAMYAKYLVERNTDSYTILAPYNSNTTLPDESNVIRCWQLDNDDLNTLFTTILNEKIWIVLIQFNYGFFNFGKLNEFIHKLVMYGRKVSITLHCTNDPIGYENKELKSLKNALSLCDNVFVQTDSDIATVNNIGLANNVKLFPLSVYEPSNDPLKLRVEKNTFVVASYGFFLPHKGFLELIDTIYLLKEERIDIHLLMLNAMYDAPISQELLNSAKQKISSLGIENEVSILSEFLSEELSIRLMRNVDLVVFPYQETDQPTSAAARMGLASGIPVAVTPLAIFDDISEVVFKLPGTSPEEMALGIKTIRNELRTQSVSAQKIISRTNSWVKERSCSVLGRTLKRLVKNSLNYYGSDQRLQTQVGQKNGLNIYSTGVEGWLFHGPYLELDAGKYRVCVHGAWNSTVVTGASADVVINHGQKMLAQSAIAARQDNSLLICLDVIITEPCTDLEVRLWVTAETNLHVSMLRIECW